MPPKKKRGEAGKGEKPFYELTTDKGWSMRAYREKIKREKPEWTAGKLYAVLVSTGGSRVRIRG